MTKWAPLLASVAALSGAAGVAAAAAAAHGRSGPDLKTAADFLILHAAAVIAVCALALAIPRRGGGCLAAGGVLLFGNLIFCGDLAMRALTGSRLFPLAAPLGGSILILGWLAVAATALAAAVKKPA